MASGFIFIFIFLGGKSVCQSLVVVGLIESKELVVWNLITLRPVLGIRSFFLPDFCFLGGLYVFYRPGEMC